MEKADSGNPFILFIYLFFECSSSREPVRWRKMGEGWEGRGERRREAEHHQHWWSGGAASLLVRESSEDAQLNWEFAVRAQPPSAAPSERRLFCRSALHAQHPLAPPLPL